MDTSATTEQRPRRARTLVILTAIVGLMTALSTAGAIAASSIFIDVDAGDTHEDGITFMADSGVTIGCTSDEYCPGDPVTRAQMATFMHRLSGNDPDTDPSVNAATLDGLTVQEIQSGVLLPTPGDPEPTLVSASISIGGAILSENEVEAVDRPTTGVYAVDFDRDISTCAIVVSLNGIPNPPAIAAHARPTDTRVLVTIRDVNGDAVNNGFDLVGVC